MIPLGFIHSNPEFIMAHGKRTTHATTGVAPNTTPNIKPVRDTTKTNQLDSSKNVQIETKSIRYKPVPRASILTKIDPPRDSLRYCLIKNITWAYLQRVKRDILKVYKDSVPSRRTLRCRRGLWVVREEREESIETHFCHGIEKQNKSKTF